MVQHAHLFLELVEYITAEMESTNRTLLWADGRATQQGDTHLRELVDALRTLYSEAGRCYNGLLLCRNATGIAASGSSSAGGVDNTTASTSATGTALLLHPPYEIMVETACAFMKALGRVEGEAAASELLLDVVTVTRTIWELEVVNLNH